MPQQTHNQYRLNDLMEKLDKLFIFLIGLRLVMLLDRFRRSTFRQYSPVFFACLFVVFWNYIYAGMKRLVLNLPSGSVNFMCNHPYLFSLLFISIGFRFLAIVHPIAFLLFDSPLSGVLGSPLPLRRLGIGHLVPL